LTWSVPDETVFQKLLVQTKF